MKPCGMDSSVPSERISSSSMEPWPHYHILGAQIVSESYELNSNNELLTCYGSPSDYPLALQHPPHDSPRSKGLCLSNSNPGSTHLYDMFPDCVGYLLVASLCLGLFTKTFSHYSGKPPNDAPNKWEIDVLHRLIDKTCTWASDPASSRCRLRKRKVVSFYSCTICLHLDTGQTDRPCTMRFLC